MLGNSGYNNHTTLGSAKGWYKHYKFAITVMGPHKSVIFCKLLYCYFRGLKDLRRGRLRDFLNTK